MLTPESTLARRAGSSGLGGLIGRVVCTVVVGSNMSASAYDQSLQKSRSLYISPASIISPYEVPTVYDLTHHQMSSSVAVNSIQATIVNKKACASSSIKYVVALQTPS